jgi:predicted AlkP superfamily phosphohydrolase/phosphomutase
MRRAVLLGISGLNPDLVKHFLDGLPVLKLMREKGAWGRLESTLPPASSPAWTNALSGRNLAALGAWDSRCRKDHAYTLQQTVDSELVASRIRPLYSVVSKLGQRVGAVNLPWTDPVPEIPGGYCVGNRASEGAGVWPGDFAGEVGSLVGGSVKGLSSYDVKRSSLDRKSIRAEMKKADENRFSLVKHLVQEKLCDLVMAVMDGTKTVSHLFLRDADSGHAYYDAQSSEREVLGDYYRFIDRQVGEILNILDDDTVLCLISVSSVQRLQGILNLNEWLIQKGYLTLKAYPKTPTTLDEAQVDWQKTKAWAMGEHGQLYINVKGREKQGAVTQAEYASFREKLNRELMEIETDEGKAIPAQVYRTEDIYHGNFIMQGPDLLLHIDEGRWRTEQRVGFGESNVLNTDGVLEEVLEGVGREGYVSMCGSDFPAVGEVKNISVIDIAPTIIDIMNLRAPYNTIDYEMEGYSLLQAIADSSLGVKAAPGGEKESEEDKVRSRLEALGY